MAQRDRKRSQIILIAILGSSVVGLFILIGLVMGPPTGQVPLRNVRPTVEETIISDRTSAASPEMSWITQGRLQMERLNKDLEEQRKLLEQARKTANRELTELRDAYDDQLLQQAAKIEELNTLLKASQTEEGRVVPGRDAPDRLSGREQLMQMHEGTEAGSDFIRRNDTNRQNARQNSGPGKSANTENGTQGFGQSFTLASLETSETELSETRTLANYLPSGSYAPAVVLSGADAATNVASRENPIPVLFRITGPAVSAATGSRTPAKVNLRGCTVQGSATGDLSSERVKVRLISMTCINRRGEVLETKVSGYIAGSGKEGVRGHVTSREGNLTKNATVAGLIGGLGSGLNTAASSQISSETATASNLLRSAGTGTLAGGVKSASETLANYYIKRAEQYQPVVSLYGGTKVELVFLEGVELGQ